MLSLWWSTVWQRATATAISLWWSSVVKSTAIFVMEYSVEKSYSYLCNGVQCGKELQLSLYWSTVWTKLKLKRLQFLHDSVLFRLCLKMKTEFLHYYETMQLPMRVVAFFNLTWCWEVYGKKIEKKRGGNVGYDPTYLWILSVSMHYIYNVFGIHESHICD